MAREVKCQRKIEGLWRNPVSQRDGTNRQVFFKEYRQWRAIIRRTTQQIPKAYVGKSMTEDWLSYDNYIEWARQQVGFLSKDENGRLFEIDRDMLNPTNKVYCPELCVFLPKELNAFIVKSHKANGLPAGVYFHKSKSKFMARLHFQKTRTHLGSFDTYEGAYRAYKEARIRAAKTLAAKWSEKVDQRVINILEDFSVERYIG